MRKLTVLLIIAAIVLSFAACTSKSNTDIRGEQIGGAISETDTSSTESEESSEQEFSLGSNDGAKYESKFLGLGCTLPEGWTFYDDAKIRELNKSTMDLAGDEYAELMKDAQVVYDMFASDAQGVNNVNVALEKVDRLQLAALDIKKNYDNLVPTLKQSFENMGYTDIQYEIAEVTVDGKKYPALNFTAKIGDAVMYQTSISKKCNGYLASIAITTYNENTVSDILGKFYHIK